MSRPDGDLVDAFYRAYNGRDAAAAVALYGPAGWHEEAHNGQRRQGRPALQQGLERFFAMLPDCQWEARERIDAGASVAVSYTLRGRLAVDLGGRATRGLPIELPGIHVFELDGNTIAGTRDYWDPAAFRRQIEAPVR